MTVTHSADETIDRTGLEPREGTPEHATWMSEMERAHGRAECIIGKQRHGPIGTVELSFEGRFTRFGNLVKPWQNGPDNF